MSKFIYNIVKLCTIYEEYGASLMDSHENGKPCLVFHDAASEEILKVYLHGKTDKQIFKEINDFFKDTRKRWLQNEKINELLQKFLDRDYNDLKSENKMRRKIHKLLEDEN